MVVHLLDRETGGGSMGLFFPMLTRANYTDGTLVMQVNMQAACLWDTVKDDDVPQDKD